MIDIQQLIADFEDCIGWPYASPGSNDERGIDCSGMFVRAYRRQGARIYHGSNTIWRKYLGDKGRINSTRDLKPGMVLTGTVRNVIDFGVFVDIGVHQDGLVHISQVCNRRLRHPSEAVKVGDIVKVVVLEVDEKRHRIGLSMKQVKE